MSERIRTDYAGRAFDAGYRTTLHRRNGSNGAHDLAKEGDEIARLYNTALQLDEEEGFLNGRVQLDAQHGLITLNPVTEALLYGVQIQPYPGVEHTLWEVSQTENDINIWTKGDPTAQIHKIRSRRWETLYGNPYRRENFHIAAGPDKAQLLAQLIERSLARGREGLVIVDNELPNLLLARDVLEQLQYQHEVTLALIHRDEETLEDTQRNVPPWVTVIPSLGLCADIASTRQNLSFLLDLDGTLCIPDGTRETRKAAVIDTITTGKRYIPRSAGSYIPVDGLFVLSGRATQVEPLQIDRSKVDIEGRQAEIYVVPRNGESMIIKLLATTQEHRGSTQDWTENGGFRGAQELTDQMHRFYRRLAHAGLNVPPGLQIYTARTRDHFCVVERAPRVGTSNLEQELDQAATYAQRKQIISEMLDEAETILLDDSISADVKPKNFVRGDDDGKLYYVDFLPVFLKSETDGTVITEWPPITSPEIQPFLSETHFTYRVLGYRWYQELCQANPMYRQEYQQIVLEWLHEKGLSEYAEEIEGIINPVTSRILQQVLDGTRDPREGMATIYQEVKALQSQGIHPIYHLREMSFTLTQAIIDRYGPESSLFDSLTDELIKATPPEMLSSRAITSVQALPPNRKIIALIRKITHLSDSHTHMGPEDDVALAHIESVVNRFCCE